MKPRFHRERRGFVFLNVLKFDQTPEYPDIRKAGHEGGEFLFVPVYERISKGTGRVIISSCSANEVSKEDDSLQHGIFSYYMLEGLKGHADQDGDGIITVSELFSYFSRKVPQASAQDQHPVKKGETEGELVIGRVK